MEVILNGVLSGIVLAFLIGPVFFTILQTSIERGFGSGALVAVGVSLSDAFYISLTYMGIYQLFDRGSFHGLFTRTRSGSNWISLLLLMNK